LITVFGSSAVVEFFDFDALRFISDVNGDESLMSTKAKAGFWLTLDVKIFMLFVVWCRIFPDIICRLG
jgi:hypothetical protein